SGWCARKSSAWRAARSNNSDGRRMVERRRWRRFVDVRCNAYGLGSGIASDLVRSICMAGEPARLPPRG
ncbi:hypothetical protein, partial [Mesorhizobium sp.]|uniref:hypothetical protein n=1 Tax=Mesorhizobium sp. TaxID=1871066 RepID=UPI0025C47532